VLPQKSKVVPRLNLQANYPVTQKPSARMPQEESKRVNYAT